jgi:hypothetical protein
MYTPIPRYGEEDHADIVRADGVEQASNPSPVKTEAACAGGPDAARALGPPVVRVCAADMMRRTLPPTGSSSSARARPAACAGHCCWDPGAPRYTAPLSNLTHA